MIEKENFNKLMDSFKKLPINKKEDETIKEMIDLFSLMNKLRQDVGIKAGVLFNKEIEDMNNIDRTREDFVEAVFAYTISFKEYFSEYIDKISNLIYEEDK